MLISMTSDRGPFLIASVTSSCPVAYSADLAQALSGQIVHAICRQRQRTEIIEVGKQLTLTPSTPRYPG